MDHDSETKTLLDRFASSPVPEGPDLVRRRLKYIFCHLSVPPIN